MRYSRMLTALAVTLAMLSGPAIAGPYGKGPPPPKPPMTKKAPNASGKSPQHEAARGAVATGKSVAQRGKQALMAQRDNLMRLIGRAEGLKPQRRALRRQAREAVATYRANPNPQTLAAAQTAIKAYKPLREAHISARAERDTAAARYQRSKAQRAAAMDGANATAGAPRPAAQGRPRMRRQAFVEVGQSVATTAPSPQNVYGQLSLVPRPDSGRPGGQYMSSASQFKIAGTSQYSSLTPAEAGGDQQPAAAQPKPPAKLPPIAVVRSQKVDDDDAPYSGGKTLVRDVIARNLAMNANRPINQNAYDDVY